MSFFGVNIKKIRQVKGLSQKAFADLFELNRGVISAYEEGRAEPKIETVLKVAHYFSLDLDDFLTKTLQVNHLASPSNIDRLMFVNETHTSSETSVQKQEISAEEKIMQKILANSDSVYEFTLSSPTFSHYQTGDILFLKLANPQNEIAQTLYTLKNENLKMVTNTDTKSKESYYKIIGYFSFEQKNILASILERIENLERK
ncbi:helix-turn-helix domain-containing protein [Chryseobacterium sp. RG1]|uniref:Helix-turn-helix domain-containing protein n=1 Tax=Chryseobacterium tagetis TaxID=2801334 RepID=A0ABS8A458_9FLAO|nr:helix-turn-helix transcriptional regulator [Chryseobacterium tagetis]MCA6068637.1 helix-turn-helix domain-containing protein [Chryseobacterium tagetis]